MKRTPLHIACLRNYLQIVKLLVSHPVIICLIVKLVDINAQDTDFNTPLHIASELGFVKIVEYLIDNKCDGIMHI